MLALPVLAFAQPNADTLWHACMGEAKTTQPMMSNRPQMGDTSWLGIPYRMVLVTVMPGSSRPMQRETPHLFHEYEKERGTSINN